MAHHRKKKTKDTLPRFKDEPTREDHIPQKYAHSLTQISRTLSYILRHGAQNESLQMRADGYVKVDELLRIPKLMKVGFLDLEKIVREDQKNRYNLVHEPAPATWRNGSETQLGPAWWIRANQGHSMKEVEVEMTPVTDPSQCPIVVHGTNHAAWKLIQKQGLSRMKRNHIHFAQGLPGTQGVISGAWLFSDCVLNVLKWKGMRQHADVYIFIDLAKALDNGFKFLLSSNGVVLCQGDERGFIPPEYFLRVETAWLNLPLPGYEFDKERTGVESLELYDEGQIRLAESKHIKYKEKYKWEDPIKTYFEERPDRRESDS